MNFLRRCPLLLLLTLFLPLCAGSCGVFSQTEEEVLVTCPELPAWSFERFGKPVFLIRYHQNGLPQQKTAPPGSPEVLLLPIGECVPILAEPVFTDPDAVLLPAGGLYPADLGCDGILRLTWLNGFAADTLGILQSAGFALKEFNSARFFRETASRGQGNPWALDRNKIIKDLSGLSFRSDRIALKTGFPAQLAVKGLWFSENLLLPACRENAEGTVDFGNLTEGLHRFYGEKAGTLSISIGPAGALIYRESGSGSALRGPSW